MCRVDNAERHLRTDGRRAVRVAHEHLQRPYGRIASRLIQKRHCAVRRDDHVVRRGPSEAAAVYQKRAACGAGEPAAVKLRFRFACAKIVPRAVAVGLDPCMVIVAVRPAGRVHLPRRNTGRTQRIDRKCGFLAAAAGAGTPRAQRADRPLVGRAVADLLRVPFVDRKDRLTCGKSLNPLRQLRIKSAPAIAELLLVYARVEHIIEKHLLRKRPNGRQPLPQKQRVLRAGAKEGKIIIRPVAERACGIAPAR